MGGASLFPVTAAPGKPAAAAARFASSPPGERQLGELFYVTMTAPIRQGNHAAVSRIRHPGPGPLPLAVRGPGCALAPPRNRLFALR